MKSSTNDQAEGKFHKVKFNIKEVAGKASLNAELKGAGKNEMQAGAIQERIGYIDKFADK